MSTKKWMADNSNTMFKVTGHHIAELSLVAHDRIQWGAVLVAAIKTLFYR